MDYPELDEFVLAAAKKLFPYGAVLALEEYGGREAFVHISEVSPGWVRNIREHLKEGQVVVAKVIAVDQAKHQVDVSVKRVSESEKRRKLFQVQSKKRAVKLLERAALKLGKKLDQAYVEAGNLLVGQYGDLFAALEAIARGEKPGIPEKWLAEISELACKEFEPKKAEVRAVMSLQCFDSDGVEKVKGVFGKLSALSIPGVSFSFHYVSAPKYFVDVAADDYKSADKALDKLRGEVEALTKGCDCSFSLEKQEKK